MRRMLINVAQPEESRVAIIETEGRKHELLELYIERTSNRGILGNIYKGIVVNVEPSIQAAFVDCGEGQNGFLHVSDVMSVYGQKSRTARGATDSDGEEHRAADGGGGRGRPRGRRDKRIQELLALGQEVLVRVSKEQIGEKGPTLTTYLSLPGRGVVLMPSLVDRVRVSSKIEDARRRTKLRELVGELSPPTGMGYILRTAAEDMDRAELEGDLRYLIGLWNGIARRAKEARAPAVLYQESDLVIRTLRDLYSPEIESIIIDEPEALERAKSFFQVIRPAETARLQLFSDAEPLFFHYEIEDEIDRTFEKRVPLPSGGSIVLEQTEALVAIDVNSGRLTDEDDIEETALRTNMEAADEIARQLRLRDLGGVIVNDFIDMKSLGNRKKVEKKFRDLLSSDRARTKCGQISQFGIIEMTRQRVGPSIKRYTHDICAFCEGHGLVKNLESMTLLCMRKIHRGMRDDRIRSIEVTGNPQLTLELQNRRRREISDLEARYEKHIVIKNDPAMPLSHVRVEYANGAGGKVEPRSS